MATKKAKYETASVPGPSAPCLYLDMQGKDVSQIKGLAIGDKVEILVTGTIKGLSQRQRSDYDDPKKTVQTGTIDLEGYKVRVMDDDSDNVFSKMAEEED